MTRRGRDVSGADAGIVPSPLSNPFDTLRSPTPLQEHRPMFDRHTRKTSRRPLFDDLDSRLLLSTAGMTLPPAQVLALNTSRDVPLLTQLTATPKQVISTIPSNGDVNPYGVAFV